MYASGNRRSSYLDNSLAEELVGIHRRLQGDSAEIETVLKEIATDAGESFREFLGRDYVSASGKVAAEFKGDVPVRQTKKSLALAPTECRRLVQRGLIKIEPQWGKASSGRAVKMYPEGCPIVRGQALGNGLI